ncbi:MAG: phosphatase PAP2 family protein [Candidatus Aminicenantes bacterium]|nr:phosphatase PAP2 family protein [Candidatus Aminicenantes bacterium]
MNNAPASSPSRVFRPLWISLAGIAAVLIILTLPFWFFELDIAFQSMFFRRGWFLENNPVVRFLYRWGTLPGLLLACAASLSLLWSRLKVRNQIWRRAAAALLLTFFLGPGLLINGISKKYTGRPRPREIAEFGGNWEYRHVFEFGVPGRGHSFPAGHPSTGFLLFSLYYSFRYRNRRRARAWLLAGCVYGGIMGMGRIVQGAHFLSDVIWSGGMTLAAARIAHAWTGGDHPERAWIHHGLRLNRSTRLVTGAVLLAVLILGILAATPYNLRSYFSMQSEQRLVLDMEVANVRIVSNENADAGIYLQARGFAPPFSRYRARWAVHDGDAVLRMHRHGFFFELNTEVKVILPRSFRGELLVRCRRGEVDIRHVPGDGRTFVETGSGRITWRGGNTPRRVLLRNRGGDVRIPDSDGYRQLMVEALKGPVRLPLSFREDERFLLNPKGEQTMRYGRWNGSATVFIDARSILFNDPENQ